MPDGPVWDGTNATIHDDNLIFDNPYEPWKNLIKTTRTVTTNIKGLQKTLRRERDRFLEHNDFAEALADRGVLRLTETIQVSSNKNFLSITFKSKEIMEAFCTEPLLVRGWNISFRPSKNFPQKKKLFNISFLNIPSETPGEHLTDFLNQYADIVGTPLHIKKEYKGIYYMTGTRVYQVTKLHQHIPHILHNIIERAILYMYHNQPINQQRKTKTTYRNRTPIYTNTEDEDSTQSETDDENQDSRYPIPKTTTTSNHQQTTNQSSTVDNQNKIEKNIQQANITTRKVKTNATKSDQKIDNPTPTLDNNNFPQLPKQTEKEDDQQ